MCGLMVSQKTLTYCWREVRYETAVISSPVGMFRRLKKKLRLEYRKKLIEDLCSDGQNALKVWS